MNPHLISPRTPLKRLNQRWIGRVRRDMQPGSEVERVYISSVKIHPTQRYKIFDSPSLTRLIVSSRVSIV